MINLKISCIILFGIFFIGIGSSQMEFGYNNNNLPKIIIEQETIAAGNITNNINNTYVNYTCDGDTCFLNNMSDVNVPSPSDDEILSWDSGTSKWIAQTLAALNNIWQLTGSIISPITEGANLNMTGGNVTADLFIGNGSLLTGISTGGEGGIWENVSGVGTFDGNINFSNMTMESKTEYSTSEIYVIVTNNTYGIYI